jgi:hypothetical protein
MEAFIPAAPVAPGNSGSSRPPFGSAVLGISSWDRGAIEEGFIGPPLGGQEANERQKKHHEGRVLLAALPIALLLGGQRRQGGPQMTLGIAVKAALMAKALPLAEHGQGHHRAPAQGGLWSWVGRGGQRGLAKVVYHQMFCACRHCMSGQPA